MSADDQSRPNYDNPFIFGVTVIIPKTTMLKSSLQSRENICLLNYVTMAVVPSFFFSCNPDKKYYTIIDFEICISL